MVPALEYIQLANTCNSMRKTVYADRYTLGQLDQLAASSYYQLFGRYPVRRTVQRWRRALGVGRDSEGLYWQEDLEALMCVVYGLRQGRHLSQICHEILRRK